ncbi:MAG: 2-dehydropantoate 2-reductase [Nibricoccus sp.]
MEKLKIAVIGPGAIGSYYGCRLAAAGEDVRFLMRSDFEAVRRSGRMVVRLPETEVVVAPPSVYSSPEGIGPCDLVIIALKTTANGVFEKLLRPLLKEKTALLTLQNGLGSDEQLAALFGAERVMGGLCFICVNRTAPGEILCIEPGSVSFGEFGRPAGERVKNVAGMFTRAGVKCAVGDNLAELRWKKLVWNVPFNGLAIAAGGITTDKILASPELEQQVRALMLEVIEAAGKLGFSVPPALIEKQIASTRPMGAYRPSSLIDYLDGREVEVESIWGEPVRRAREVGAAVPRMELLYALLKNLTAR